MATDVSRTTTTKVEETTKQVEGGKSAGDADRKLPENAKDNLDAKLDNAVDESFPGSDPVSVKITK